MAKKKRSRRRKQFTIPLAIAAPVIAKGTQYVRVASSTNVENALGIMTNQFTGYDPRNNSFNISNMKYGLLPITIGVVAHKFAGKIGINRALANAGIPFIRI